MLIDWVRSGRPDGKIFGWRSGRTDLERNIPIRPSRSVKKYIIWSTYGNFKISVSHEWLILHVLRTLRMPSQPTIPRIRSSERSEQTAVVHQSSEVNRRWQLRSTPPAARIGTWICHGTCWFLADSTLGHLCQGWSLRGNKRTQSTKVNLPLFLWGVGGCEKITGWVRW